MSALDAGDLDMLTVFDRDAWRGRVRLAPQHGLEQLLDHVEALLAAVTALRRSRKQAEAVLRRLGYAPHVGTWISQEELDR